MDEPKGLRLDDIADEPQKTEEGVWIVFDEASGARVRIASLRSDGYNTKLGKIMAKARRRNRNRNFDDPDVFRPIMYQAMYGTVVKGWERILGKDGNPLEFTLQNFTGAMTAKKRFRDFVFEEAGDDTNFSDQEPDGEEPSKGALKSGPPVAAEVREFR